MPHDPLEPLQQYDGRVGLFPLPNVVLFPHVTMGLHVFEPRYRQLTVDSLAGDRLLALVLLRPGWEANYEGQPAIHDVACLARIQAEQRLIDGRFNLHLYGLERVRIRAELDEGRLYRTARAERTPDQGDPGATAAAAYRRELSRLTPAWCPAKGPARDVMRRLFRKSPPLGVLCDILAFALPVMIEVKQELLEETDVESRARLLIRHLAVHPPPADVGLPRRLFPPQFSMN